ETKEQFLGFYTVDCDTLEEAIQFAKDLAVANPGLGSYEIRPVAVFHPSELG
ncbi:MAG TPA: YciI family protein, partial [Devosia sp.]|nr:YciI family protein [Devosia sp.]